MPKRVSTFSNDLADGAILCQAVASHVPHFTAKGGPLHGFIPVHSTGKLKTHQQIVDGLLERVSIIN